MLHEYQHEDDSRLRTALAGHYDWKLLPDQFLTANSALELIEMIVRAFVEPGQECIISSPTFLAYKNFVELQGGKVIDIPLDRENFSLDPDELLRAITNKTRLIFITSPNNPTGAIIPRKILDRLMESLPSHVVLVYDEVYRHFVRDRNYAVGLDYVKNSKQIIGLNSFSKAFGLAGLRVGYAYSTPEITGYVSRLRRPFMISVPAMEGAMAALRDKQYLYNVQRVVREEKNWIQDCFDDLGLFYWPSQGNFLLFVPPYEGEEFTADLLSRGIMVRETSVFGLPGCIRLSMGMREANSAFITATQKLMEWKQKVK
jgi:histidinol-phosphate aminotransferase